MSDPDGESPGAGEGSAAGEDPVVLVRRRGVHGMGVGAYAAELRDRLPDGAVRVARTPAEERALVGEAAVVTAVDLPEDLLERADSLELFACAYAGADHLPFSTLEERGIAVTTASGVHAPNVAEYALGAILAFSRRFHVARRRAERREWRGYRADELHGSTVAVVGQGAIGTAVCERLAPFGVERVAVRHSPDRETPAERVLGYDRVHEALAGAAHVVLACPLTDLTRGLLDGEALATLPPDAHLVNVARGPVVDTPALVDALRSNDLGGATLDVTDPEPLPPDHPLWTFGNVRITPHSAGHTPRYYERLADVVAGNVRRLGTGEELVNRVVR